MSKKTPKNVQSLLDAVRRMLDNADESGSVNCTVIGAGDYNALREAFNKYTGENAGHYAEELRPCKTCGGDTPVEDLDEDGDCPDCQKNKGDDEPTSCECDNTHKANDTVCRWCWKHGRRHWNDPEVEGPDNEG